MVAKSFSRILSYDSSERKQYSPGETESVDVKWGQRKLLLGIIEFITTYSNELDDSTEKKVVYVSAAPGTHIPYLAGLFPHLKFILYDYRPFDFDSSEISNVEVNNTTFNDWIARQYADDNILFICDLRSHAENLLKLPKRKQEQVIKEDMMRQMKWYQAMNPVKAYLKFRLPWRPGITEYLDGDIYCQPWSGPHSTETRLIPNGRVRKYDHTVYEEQMFYFNTETRKDFYPHDYECLNNSYDSMSEILILTQYITKIRQLRKLAKVKKEVSSMSNEITELLTKNNTSYLKPPFVKED